MELFGYAEYRFDQSRVDVTEERPLHFAAFNGNLEMVNLLLSQACININKQTYRGETALLVAVKGHHFDVIKRLVAAGCDVNLGNQFYAPLHLAIKESCFSVSSDIACFLIDHGADINALAGSMTPLMMAMKHRNYKILCKLLSYNVDMSVTNKQNMTAFMYACRGRTMPELAYALLPYVTDFSTKNRQGYNCLHLALKNDHQISLDLIELMEDSVNDVVELGEVRSALNFGLLFRQFALPLIYWNNKILINICNTRWVLLPEENEAFTRKVIQTLINSMDLRHKVEPALTLLSDIRCAARKFWWFELLAEKGIFDIFMHYNDDLRNSFSDTITTVILEESDLNIRFKMVSMYLSRGGKFSWDDLHKMYKEFGFEDLLQKILSIDRKPLHSNKVICFGIRHVLDASKITSRHEIMREYMEDCESNDDMVLHHSLFLLRYFCVPEHYSYIFQLTKNHLSSLLLRIPKKYKFPSLIELSRNAVYSILSFEEISSMFLPKRIKQILLFECPLYDIPHYVFQTFI